MKISTKITLAMVSIVIVASFIGGYMFSQQPRFGNQSILPVHSACQLAAATSSVTVLATSTATAVLTCDAYNIDSSIPLGTAIDSSVLGIQFTAASSTASELKYVITYSNDGSDYYSGESIIASSTLTNSSTSRTNYLIDVPTPTRYVRATFSNTATDATVATSSVWAEFIVKKQVK